jgi:hypothetical protein
VARNNPGISEALRALKLRKGPPSDDDRPPPGVFPGKKVKLIPGQLDLAGNQHGEQPGPEPEGDEAA